MSPGGKGSGEETQLPTPSVVPILLLLLLLLHRPPLPWLFQNLIFTPPKDVHCLHCRSHLCATCLGVEGADPSPPWRWGPVLLLGPQFLHGIAVCSPSQLVRHPFKSFWTAFMHLEPSEAFRSDPLCFELNRFIYSFWTLKSLTGVYLPFGVRPYTLLIKPTTVSPSRLSPLQLPLIQLPTCRPGLPAFPSPQW